MKARHEQLSCLRSRCAKWARRSVDKYAEMHQLRWPLSRSSHWVGLINRDFTLPTCLVVAMRSRARMLSGASRRRRPRHAARSCTRCCYGWNFIPDACCSKAPDVLGGTLARDLLRSEVMTREIIMASKPSSKLLKSRFRLAAGLSLLSIGCGAMDGTGTDATRHAFDDGLSAGNGSEPTPTTADSAAPDCSLCAKANDCCTAVATAVSGDALCTFSAKTCSEYTAAGRAAYVNACQTLLTTTITAWRMANASPPAACL